MEEKAGIIFIHFNEIEAFKLVQEWFPDNLEIQVHSSTVESLKPKFSNPAAVVISLERLPSHGKQYSLYFRSSAARRKIPLIFTGGKPEKIEIYRELFTDAFFCNFEGLSDLFQI